MTSEALRIEILRQIREQLEPRLADELVFYASDDPVLFSATVVSLVRAGNLNLDPELLHLLNDTLRGIETP